MDTTEHPEHSLADVVGVDVLDDYRLRLCFEDGTIGDVHFRGRVWRGVFAPLRDPRYFGMVRVDPRAGTIVWPNGADMAPETLYALASSTRPTAASPAGSRHS
jgi:hypothetical protein